MSKNFGLVYVASGKKYRTECNQSAKSAKKLMPDVPISIWTDDDTDLEKEYFDSIMKMENPTYSFYDKISPLIETPYDNTLFVDTDTYFLDSVYELTDLLENFDLGFCHAPYRICPGENNVIENIPICFPEPNTGVIAYRKNEHTIALIKSWEQIYSRQLKSDNSTTHDQPALREAMYFSPIRLTVLPPEYNVRTIFPVFIGGNAKAKILHGRGATLQEAIKEVNKRSSVRIYDFRPQNQIVNRGKKFVKKILRIK